MGLLTIVIWSDIEPRSGGTLAATDSFRPTGPRERVVPEREANQACMLAQEEQRLGIS